MLQLLDVEKETDATGGGKLTQTDTLSGGRCQRQNQLVEGIAAVDELQIVQRTYHGESVTVGVAVEAVAGDNPYQLLTAGTLYVRGHTVAIEARHRRDAKQKRARTDGTFIPRQG